MLYDKLLSLFNRICGRAGRDAVINFITSKEVSTLRDIEGKAFLVQRCYSWLKFLDIRIL